MYCTFIFLNPLADKLTYRLIYFLLEKKITYFRSP